ncbi:Sodium/potassium/calcium exchanger 1 [Dissostichus eleginoides]|uniref:Sodium/potassium/calcium exchanger 1 n=1 Tax=Dissostichus eleginoides TaxID=100907 RepID=A0AAD9C9E7_DISEL|nr:Sodium/potassium/calcium exchanger 1 [Dissostichus eleginoides]
MSAISSRLFSGRREREHLLPASLHIRAGGERERRSGREASRREAGGEPSSVRARSVCLRLQGGWEAAGGPEQEDQSEGSLCGGEEEEDQSEGSLCRGPEEEDQSEGSLCRGEEDQSEGSLCRGEEDQ